MSIYADGNVSWLDPFDGFEPWEPDDEPEVRAAGGCAYCEATEVREWPEPFGGQPCCERCFALLIGDESDDPSKAPTRGGDEMTLVQPEGVPSPNRAAVDGYAGSSDGRASGARMTGPTEPASVGEGCRQTPRGESSGCQGQPIVASAVDGARGVHGAPGTPSQS